MKKIFFAIAIITLIAGCKTKDIIQKYPAPDLTDKEIRKIEANFIDFKSDMLYEKYDKALQHIDNVLKIDSLHPVAFYERSKLWYKRDSLSKALQDIDFALKREPNNSVYRKFQVLLAQDQGNLEFTDQLYQALIEDFPRNRKTWFNAVDFYLTNEKYEKALILLEKFEKRFGFNKQILVNKYKLLVQLEQFGKLEKTLKDYAEKFPRNENVLELLGEFYFNTKHKQKGLKVYNMLLTLNAENTVALLALADYYRSNLQFNKSFDYIEKVVNSQQLTIDKKIEILLRFMKIAQKDPQLEYYYKTLVESLKQQYPDNSDVQLLYGNLLVQDGNYEKAQIEFENALNHQPDNIQAWIKLIMIDNELDSNQAIIKHTEKALEYYPNQAELYYYRGLAFMLEEQYDKAVDELEFGNKITGKNDPLKFQFLYFLGETYYNVDSINNAFDYFDKALKIKPDEISLLNNYAYYLSEHDIKLDKAEQMSLKTIKKAPSNSTYLDTYAWILYKNNQYQKAHKYIKQAVLNGGSNSAVIMEHYGDILFKLGNKKEAVTTWKEGSKLEDATETIKEKAEKEKYVE